MPVCACSVDDEIVVVLVRNPLVFWRVSVPVCWLGVRSSGLQIICVGVGLTFRLFCPLLPV